MKMNPEIKQKWVEALRSGRYKQGNNALLIQAQGGARYCCMGVLCEIVDGIPPMGDAVFPTERTWKTCEMLPEVELMELEAILSRMNDEEGKTFPEIAQWIEENL